MLSLARLTFVISVRNLTFKLGKLFLLVKAHVVASGRWSANSANQKGSVSRVPIRTNAKDYSVTSLLF